MQSSKHNAGLAFLSYLEVHLQRRPVRRAGARQRGPGAARLEEAEEEEGDGEEGRGEERLVQEHLGRHVAGGVCVCVDGGSLFLWVGGMGPCVHTSTRHTHTHSHTHTHTHTHIYI